MDGAALIGKHIAEAAQTETKDNVFVETKLDTLPVSSSQLENQSQSLIDVSSPPREEIAIQLAIQEPFASDKIIGSSDDSPGFAARPLPDGEPLRTQQQLHSKPVVGDRFELLAQEEIKKAFPSGFARSGVQIRSLNRTAEVDLFVLLPKGLFLVECKNYSGKISGSLNYDQKQGEFWTCETPTGDRIQITSSGKNPADQALGRFHTLHDLAKEAWGEANRPYIFPVLLFPNTADLSGITQMTVYPERPSTADRVVATTLSKVIGYLANADSAVEQTGALKLTDFLGIPRSSLSGTWLVEQPADVDKAAPGGNRQTDRRLSGKRYERPSEHGIGDAAYKEEIPTRGRADLKASSPPRKQADEMAGESVRNVPPRPRSRQARWPLVAFMIVVVVLIGFMIKGQLTSKPSVETASQNITSPQAEPPQERSVDPVPPVQPEAQLPPSTSGFVPQPPISPVSKTITVEPQKPSRETNIREARVRETPFFRPPAEPGNYETIRITNARREPNDGADVIDELRPGTRLNVTGSQGEWLVVRSRTRQMTVYVKRDDAMFVSVKSPGGESYQEAEARWKKVEEEIGEALARRGVSGVTVSFIGDTAYLKGQVKTENERFLAEMAAKSIPEVQHIINRIRLNP
jgi:hypothetical protein